MRFKIAVLGVVCLLAACETPTTQRYAISADNNAGIKALGVSNVIVLPFSEPAYFDPNCRAYGPLLVADGKTHTQYIQKAFEDEFKLAGASGAKVTPIFLSGRVSRLEFSSANPLTSGFWSIRLDLESSNGRSMKMDEYYGFASGFIANEACRNTADAFSRAVQDLVGKTVRSAFFPPLLVPVASR